MRDRYVVRVQSDTATLFAFLLDVPQRFISYDNKPRVMARTVAMEIQDWLVTSLATATTFTISVERVGASDH